MLIAELVNVAYNDRLKGEFKVKKNVFILLIFSILVGCTVTKSPTLTGTTSSNEDGYTVYEVDACDTTTKRKPNAKVDVGFGEKVYWAYTNEYGQLVRISADEIFLQDEENEPVTDKGRYCNDIADVPGTELKQYQRGHIVADSLSGNSNVYNITPQEAYLNMHGNQSYMEDQIRKALNAGLPVTDFEAIITYPNNETQIPNHYKYTYKINGELIVDEFDNVDPRSVPIEEENNGSDFSDEREYVLNINSKKIHTTTCEAVTKMSDKNKEEYVGNINDLLNQGFETCGICNPK